MKIFVSYHRSDQQAVARLVVKLQGHGHSVWSDAELYGGQLWWSEILDQIEQSDAVILALSPAFLRSIACARERHYAFKLGKSLFPIEVAPVNERALPEDLQGIMLTDSAGKLADALSLLPPAPPLPDPMPTRPTPPISEYALMRDRICAGQLDRGEQFAIIAELLLLSRSDDSADRHAAHELLDDINRSMYLFAGPARLLQKFKEPSPQPAPAVAAPVIKSTPWRAIIGAAIGSIGITSLFILVGMYRILPKPYELVVPNAALAGIGALLCSLDMRHHPRSAKLGLVICAISVFAASLDLVLHVI